MTVITREDLVGYGNFIQVRASLIRKLGGKTGAAIVLSAIEFQTTQGRLGDLSTGDDGTTWWRANMKILSDWTGMSVQAVQRAVAALVKLGVLVSDRRRQDGPYDQTYSYALVLDGVTPTLHNGVTTHDSDPKDRASDPEDVHDSDPKDVHDSDPKILPIETWKTGGEGAQHEQTPHAQTPLPLATVLRFPTQCSQHQDDWNDSPCHGCRRARVKAEELDAAAAAFAKNTPTLRCPEHLRDYSVRGECSGCAGDRKGRRGA